MLKRSKAINLEEESEDSENDFFKIENQKIRENMKVKILILFPDDGLRTKWELLVTILLIFTSIVTPYRIAFYEVDLIGWQIVDHITDILFAIDIIINFFCFTKRI